MDCNRFDLRSEVRWPLWLVEVRVDEGHRHLAELWAEPMRSPSATTAINTPLQQITTFVLLDLIGSPNPVIHNFYHQVRFRSHLAGVGINQDAHRPAGCTTASSRSKAGYETPACFGRT